MELKLNIEIDGCEKVLTKTITTSNSLVVEHLQPLIHLLHESAVAMHVDRTSDLICLTLFVSPETAYISALLCEPYITKMKIAPTLH